jgi:hypothetical protein
MMFYFVSKLGFQILSQQNQFYTLKTYFLLVYNISLKIIHRFNRLLIRYLFTVGWDSRSRFFGFPVITYYTSRFMADEDSVTGNINYRNTQVVDSYLGTGVQRHSVPLTPLTCLVDAVSFSK